MQIHEAIIAKLRNSILHFSMLSFVVSTLSARPCYSGGIAQKAGGVASMGMAVASVNVEGGEWYQLECKTDAWACPLAVLSFAAGAAAVLESEEASGTKSKVQASSGNFDDGFGNGLGANPGAERTPEQEKLLVNVGKKLATLKAKGYSVDPKTGMVTTPKGKFPGKTFASGKSMADAGLISADQIDNVDNLMKQVAKDSARVIAMGIAGGSGGSSSSTRTSSYKYEDPYASLYGNKEKPRDPRTTGLTRNIASGESIGTQTDNLFEMIKRSYQKKSDEKIFVGQEGSR